MDYKRLVNYWLKTAGHDFDVMLSLYKSGKYDACLFYGHIILEKILKAHVVNYTKKEATKIHNLVRLAGEAACDLTARQIDLLAKVNQFNMRTRYPDEKFEFYKLCDKKYTDNYYNDIIDLYKNLCQKIKQNAR